MDILFWILLTIVIVFSIIGYVRGFIKSLIRIILTVATIIVAYFVAPLVGQIIIETTDIDDKIEIIISQRIQAEVEKKARETYKKELESEYGKYADLVDDKMIDDLLANRELSKTEEMEIINQINAPKFVKKILKENNSKEFMKKIGVNNFYEYIAKYIAYMIVKMFAFICVLVIFSLISICIYIALTGLAKLPVLRSVDKMAGLFFGALEGILICWVIIIIFDCVNSINSPTVNSNSSSENKIIEKFYESDIVDNIINKIIRME